MLAGTGSVRFFALNVGQLRDTALVAATLERGRKERGHDLFGKTDTNDTRTHRQDVRVVVAARHARGVQAIAQCGTDSSHLVGGQLLALPAATENDAEVDLSVAHRPADRRADRRVVTTVGRVGAHVVDTMARGGEKSDEMLLQFEACMVGADGDVKGRNGHGPSIGGDATGTHNLLCMTTNAAAIDPRTPVLVGCGQSLQRPDDPRAASFDTAADPVALMVEAIRAAAADAGLSRVPDVDAIRVVSLLSWKYGNPAWFAAQDLGISAHQYGLSANGGNTPQTLVNNAALEIQSGKADVIILTGGEASRTKQRAKKAGHNLTWRKADASVPAAPLVSADLEMVGEQELARRIVMPVQVYPMFETAIRARAGRSVADHQVHISELWSRFSRVAADNPYAWSRRAIRAEEIRTPGPDNRMIGFPYPKYMNSNNDVDMGAALIVCSAEKAQSLGVPRDRWVFIHSGADCHEHKFISNRWTFAETPAVALGGKRALELAGVGIDDIEIVDLYSCFPSAVQLGAQSLGLDINAQLTRTGGLPFAGGPWNNYVMHAIATVMNDVRVRPGAKGLVWANGGYTTKHAFGVYSTEPPKSGFRHAHPQDEIDAMPRREVAKPDEAAGTATLEAYSVMHGRDGAPEMIHAACLLADGRRAWGESTDAELGRAMCSEEFVGRRIELDAAGVLHVA